VRGDPHNRRAVVLCIGGRDSRVTNQTGEEEEEEEEGWRVALLRDKIRERRVREVVVVAY